MHRSPVTDHDVKKYQFELVLDFLLLLMLLDILVTVLFRQVSADDIDELTKSR